MTVRLDTHELAWAAGFFDGEGGVYVSKSRQRGSDVEYWGWEVKLPQSDIRPLERIQRACLGLGSIRPLNRGKNQLGVKPMWGWRVGGNMKAQAALALLWKYLSEPKKKQAVAARWVRGRHQTPWLGQGSLLTESPRKGA